MTGLPKPVSISIQIECLVNLIPGIKLVMVRRLCPGTSQEQIALAIKVLLTRGWIWLAPNDCYYPK